MRLTEKAEDVYVTKPRSKPLPKGAAGGRWRRRNGYELKAWARPFRRASRALDVTTWLIFATLNAISAAKECAEQPVLSARKLRDAANLLIGASAYLGRAAQAIGATSRCFCPDPEEAADIPDIVAGATDRWAYLAQWIAELAEGVFASHADVLRGLETGTLVPEPDALEPPKQRRPRIILAPRPVYVRAFLAARQPRATDRIASTLSRRRRIPRPAAVSVPRRSHTGRAPPLFSACLL